MSRRDLINLSIAGAMTSVVAAKSSGATALPRPNILWLVSEDNGPFIGAYGDKIAHTPAIDSLARRGLLYRHAYANAPVCSVSRFGILTGVYAQSCGGAQNQRTQIAHPPALKGYPAYLRQAGYYCTNNHKTDYNTAIDPLTLWDDSSDKAHWRNRPANAPFMAVFNSMTTHASSLFEPTEGRVKPEDVRVPAYLPDTAVTRRDIASYYNRMEIMDGEIGARLAELQADGLMGDTVIFYFSDHGGVHPRSKKFCYEEGLHAPLIIVFPSKHAHLAPAPMGSEIGSVVSFIDLAPTVLALAGIAKPQEMVGSSLLDHEIRLGKRYAFGARNRMEERIDFTRTITDGRYRYLRNYMPNRPWVVHDGYGWQTKSWQDWARRFLSGELNSVQARYFGPKPYEELYDTVPDPDQITDLVDRPDQQARLNELRAALDRQMLAINDNGFIAEGTPLEGYENSRVPGAYPLQRIMEVAAAAARRDASHLDGFRTGLTDDNEVVRYWSAQGLLMLGPKAGPARAALERCMNFDSPHVRIVAAEALAGMEEAAAVGVLAELLDTYPTLPIKQQALNSLAALTDSVFRSARPSLERWANMELEGLGFNWWTVRSLARYLVARLNGEYRPDYLTFEWRTTEQLNAARKQRLKAVGGR